MKNRRYIGEYKYRDIVTPNGVPAIVPQDLFDRVGERLEKNKKAPARAKAKEEMYLLTTKLFCGNCGAYMCGESGTSHTGVTHHYYKCVTAKYKKDCHKKTVKKDWIENLVIEHIVRLLFDDNLMNNITDSIMVLQKRENITLPLLKQQLADTTRGIENIINAIQQGIFTQSTKQRLDELEERKSQLEIEILQEEMQKPLLTREQVLFWLHRFRTLDITDPDHRQRLVDSFVNSIYLYDDKIVLMFNYKEGSKTISFADIESSSLSAGGALNGQNPLFGQFYRKEGSIFLQFTRNKGVAAIGIFVDYKKSQNTAEKIFRDFTFLKVAKKASATALSQGRPEFEKDCRTPHF